MDNVIQFSRPPVTQVSETMVATCGCGGQQFALFCKRGSREPAFVYCLACNKGQSRFCWDWADGPLNPAA